MITVEVKAGESGATQRGAKCNRIPRTDTIAIGEVEAGEGRATQCSPKCSCARRTNSVEGEVEASEGRVTQHCSKRSCAFGTDLAAPEVEACEVRAEDGSAECSCARSIKTTEPDGAELVAIEYPRTKLQARLLMTFILSEVSKKSDQPVGVCPQVVSCSCEILKHFSRQLAHSGSHFTATEHATERGLIEIRDHGC